VECPNELRNQIDKLARMPASTGSTCSTEDISQAMTQIQTPLVTLQSQASTLGSILSVVQTRQDFIKSMINTLRTGADNLTLADIDPCLSGSLRRDS
jgi:flagellin